MRNLFKNEIDKVLLNKSIRILLEDEEKPEKDEESSDDSNEEEDLSSFEFPENESDHAADDESDDTSEETDEIPEDAGISTDTLETLFSKTVSDIDERLQTLERQFSEYFVPESSTDNIIDKELTRENYFMSSIKGFLFEDKDKDNDRKIEKLKLSIDKLTDFSELITRQFDDLHKITIDDIDTLSNISSKIIINFDKFEYAWSQIQKYITLNAKESDRDEIIRRMSDKFIEMCREKFDTDVSSIVGQSVENASNFKVAVTGTSSS